MTVNRRVVAIAVGVVAVAAVLRFLPVTQWLEGLEHWVRAHGLLGAAVYVLAYVGAALLFVPGSVLTLGAGALFGVLWGTVLVSLASTTAAALAFLIARHLARASVERWAGGDRRFAAIDQAIKDGGWRIVALLRLSPVVPFSLSNYLYGLTPVAFGPYVLASWVAMLPATVVFVWLGAAGRAAAGGERSAQEWALIAAGLVATLVATTMLTRMARRRLGRVAGSETDR